VILIARGLGGGDRASSGLPDLDLNVAIDINPMFEAGRVRALAARRARSPSLTSSETLPMSRVQALRQ